MLPRFIESEEQLIELMSQPDEELIHFFRTLEGDLMILGIGGKIGTELGILAINAIKASGVERKVYGVSRFSKEGSADYLTSKGVITIAADLQDKEQVKALPDVENIIFLAGKKFGSTEHIEETWGMNVVVPHIVAERFTKSRIVVYSSGNIYPFVDRGSGGSLEQDAPLPVGEYANSCVGRERVFSYHALINKNPMLMFRLNYAVEMRYGILTEIAKKVYREEPVDLTVGQFNVMWQGDVIRYTLLSLQDAANPPQILNVTGPETVSTRQVAEYFAKYFGKDVQFTGEEADNVLLNNAGELFKRYGYPKVSLNQIMNWTAHWIAIDGKSLNKPTHYDTRDGKF